MRVLARCTELTLHLHFYQIRRVSVLRPERIEPTCSDLNRSILGPHRTQCALRFSLDLGGTDQLNEVSQLSISELRKQVL